MCISFASTVSSQTSVNIDPDFCKGKKAGNYSHPTYCPGYYTCREDYSSETIFIVCPSGLVYDEEMDVCDLRENVTGPCSETGPIEAR